MRWLAGDIGGTSTRLAIFTVRDGAVRRVAEEIVHSRDFSGLDQIAQSFLSRQGLTVERAAFGIAGPVIAGVVRTPNLPWVIVADDLAKSLQIEHVDLINDLEANAWGIGALQANDIAELQAGDAAARGNRAVISAGTGLGEAGLYFDGAQHRPFACEGGHADYAPRNALEIQLLEFLRRRWDRISYERVLSGPGLRNIYEFFRDELGRQESQQIAAACRSEDPPTVISRAAMAGECPLCVESLNLFVAIYGAAAGNVALTMMATGGMYIGGGIAPKILSKLKEPAFIEAFLDKGRMRPLLAAMPLRVILNVETALLGAGRYAAARAGALV